MRQVWQAIWSLVSLIIGSAMPVANGMHQYASAFEASGRIVNKAAQNFEASVDLDKVASELALRKARLAAEQETQS